MINRGGRMEKENKQEFEAPIKYSDEYYYTILNKSRRILLYADIDDVSACVINSKMRGMDLESNDPIYLEINSGGGDIPSGLSIIDTINALNSPVITIVSGMAASMAFTIAICGKKRWAYKSAWFMQHPVSSMIGEEYAKFIKDQIGFLGRIERQLDDIISKNTALTSEQKIRYQNGELWLSAKQAKKFGVIDKII
jgi:ATP-dependent Clp protease protease subunit